ncbi:adenylate cyclase [Candida albicans SC5314]|nr:adenylate cyclase [Candida albicans SC5314]
MSFLRRDKSKANFRDGSATGLEEPVSPTTHFSPNVPPPLDGNHGDHYHDPDSPRSSVVSLPQLIHNSATHHLKENYRGFHANKRPKGIANVPPLAQPIKPRFKKKSNSLLNKLIYSTKKEDDETATSGKESRSSSIISDEKRKSASSASSGSSRQKFRFSSFDSNLSTSSSSPPKDKKASISDTVSDSSTVTASMSNMPTISIDLNLDEMHDIIKSPETPTPTTGLPTQKAEKKVSPTAIKNWQAPESWDVKAPIKKEEPHAPKIEEVAENDVAIDNVLEKKRLPVLYGTHQVPHVTNSKDIKSSHIIRVFKEDNTFTTILCPLETTTSELLAIVQKKFFLESTTNFQLSVCIGNCVKVLEDFEKPLKIQMGLLLLSGYTEEDKLRMLGREDLSFVCKFVVENIFLRSLTHDEEVLLSRNYVDVNISSLNLKNVPIIFHQHTYEIEKLNVANNPSIYLPLDFIQGCTSLAYVDFSHNGCSKFPNNLLEAPQLTHLNLEMNFLDEIPQRISCLSNLTNLKLSSNQLYSLPHSFSTLTNLKQLDLSSNYFDSYPEAVNKLTNLVELNFSYNDLSIIPESIANLINLQKLNLCTNKLSGTLPGYLSQLKALKRLDIRYNYISNVDVLGIIPNLEVAYASKNAISTFSDQMKCLRLLHFDRNPITELKFNTQMQMLSVLDLSRAKITAFPAEFVEKVPNIEKLVLDKNHLVSLPNELCQLSKLVSLSVHANNLQSLPANIGDLRFLKYLDLHSNNLKSLPDQIWDLCHLTSLNVASNNLTSFPKAPYSVVKRLSSSLVDVHLESSQTLSLADSLLILILSDNRLSDDCFDEISFLIALKSLNVSYNDLIEIPQGTLSRLTRLNELYLSGNELTTLPADDLEVLKSLKLLYMNNNKLVSLPAELSRIANLQHLDVSSNQLKYNISNWPYDWSWHWNKNLKYLNFSGNKRFEIKQSHIKNPETGEDFDSLLVLKQLRVLGLIDVTLTTTNVPEQAVDLRLRTTASEFDNFGYGVSDSLGMRDHVSARDLFVQKFRGKENEMLLCAFDGKHGATNQGHRISLVAKNMFVRNFTKELDEIKNDDEIENALRKAFLNFNKEINGILTAKKNKSFTPVPNMSKEALELNLVDDGNAGCTVSVIYIKDKKLYSANIGDIEALLCRNNGDQFLLTEKHDPTNREEFERIRASGGYVSGGGELDGQLSVSRGVGFFNFLPHTHCGPTIRRFKITNDDDMIILGSKQLWDFISYESAVDIIRKDKNDPMVAAQKLRDFAICYGATDKICVIVLTFGNRQKQAANMYSNYGVDRRRRDKQQVVGGDSNLRKLEQEIEPPIGPLALVFTDIKNSTLLWDSYPAPMRSAIKIHNTIMRRQLRITGGYEVKTEGDAFMVAFPSPTAALLWCFQVQQNLVTADWPSEILETDQCCVVSDSENNTIFRGLSVRMGIHWGSPVCEPDVITGRMDYFGPMVNRASRISAIADGGQIAVSSDFLDVLNSLTVKHNNIKNNVESLIDAYQGNENAGMTIERELNALEDLGCNYFKIGERKLKGLETPEPITLVFTNRLKLRYDIFQKRLDANHSTRVAGTLPVEIIYGLRTVSLRLENLCSSINNGGNYCSEGFESSSGVISQKMNSSFKDSDLISLLNHVTTRIESCTTTLFLRQQLSQIKGNGGLIETNNSPSLDVIMDEIADIMKTVNELK